VDVTRTATHRQAWNKGKLVGQKTPFKLQEIWAIRIRLQMQRRLRELALFDLGIDSKLRACDLVKLRVRDVCHGDRLAARAIVLQQKTQRPVQFEITQQTREALEAWIKSAGLKADSFLFSSRVRRSPHLGTRQYARIVHDWVGEIGLDPATYRDRYPHELSGGQQQRVGVARALGADPPVLLMDEPFGAIDPITRIRLQEELLAIQAGVRKTIVFVTHDIDEAVKLGDRIVILAEDGTLAQCATARELLANPASPFVESFVGSDRAVMLLSVTPIERSMLQPLELRDENAPTVDSNAVIGAAFGLMVLHGTDRVVVVDAATDERLGVVTAEAVTRLRSTREVGHSEV